LFRRKRITGLDDVQVVGDGKYRERFAGGSICRYDNFGGGGCGSISDVGTSERKFVWNLDRDGRYKASEGTVGGGGAPPLLQPFNCWTANSGAGRDCFGDDWLIVTETPANEFGSGKVVAFCGFAVPRLNPETKNVVI
jgi:hypothetical protein